MVFNDTGLWTIECSLRVLLIQEVKLVPLLSAKNLNAGSGDFAHCYSLIRTSFPTWISSSSKAQIRSDALGEGCVLLPGLSITRGVEYVVVLLSWSPSTPRPSKSVEAG